MAIASPATILPECFNRVESMLFAPQPDDLRRAAEQYAGSLLCQPVAPPPVRHRAAVPEPAILAELDLESTAPAASPHRSRI